MQFFESLFSWASTHFSQKLPCGYVIGTVSGEQRVNSKVIHSMRLELPTSRRCTCTSAHILTYQRILALKILCLINLDYVLLTLSRYESWRTLKSLPRKIVQSLQSPSELTSGGEEPWHETLIRTFQTFFSFFRLLLTVTTYRIGHVESFFCQ